MINAEEAATVRTLFRLYLKLGTVKKLVEASQRAGLVTKWRVLSGGRVTGGLPFTRGHLYQLLANPVYAGEVAHRGVAYPGQQDAIVDRQTFDEVRSRLNSNAAKRVSAANAGAPSLLTGFVYDETGDRLCPTHANKRGRRYRYYISKRLMHGTSSTGEGWRVPAKELERVVARAVGDFLKDKRGVVDALQLIDTPPARLQTVLDRAVATADALHEGQAIRALVHRATLRSDAVAIQIRRGALGALL